MTLPENAATALLVGTSGGLSFAVGLQFFKWLIKLATDRMDAREARIDEAMHKLVEQLQGQVANLLERVTGAEARLDECQAKHAESEERYRQLLGTVNGLGDARQKAAAIVAADRVADNRRNGRPRDVQQGDLER